ncbi:transcription factor [Pseudozyma hubeiensis SY62]|uniref:Transcription factor n=1 Tax=Pseudozyma hubeiensis (strain SY62) TaxID=1305764 RepID=R9P8L8_PSEHS|nr:transcription factor [Pseudozyma hubeiensis SY62]GAC97728.1 transcription factor [Pseudozyma hubeiensis SY62]
MYAYRQHACIRTEMPDMPAVTTASDLRCSRRNTAVCVTPRVFHVLAVFSHRSLCFFDDRIEGMRQIVMEDRVQGDDWQVLVAFPSPGVPLAIPKEKGKTDSDWLASEIEFTCC